MREMAGRLPSPGRFSGSEVTRETVMNMLEYGAGRGSVAIFCGHGLAYALLGPPCEPDIEIYRGKKHSRVYDSQSLDFGPESLFAFCCNAGKGLGPMFASLPGRAFLGYTAEIGLDVENEDYVKIWRGIVQGVSTEIIKDGCVLPQHERLLRNLYQAALEWFREERKDPTLGDLGMLMYILRHRKLLCRYGGTANVPNA
jgi:hypothetical protein